MNIHFKQLGKIQSYTFWEKLPKKKIEKEKDIKRNRWRKKKIEKERDRERKRQRKKEIKKEREREFYEPSKLFLEREKIFFKPP